MVYNLRCSSARTFPVSQLEVQTFLLSVCWIFTEKKFGLEADMFVRFKISITLALVHLSILDDLNDKYGEVSQYL
jgi:hypothetical protein